MDYDKHSQKIVLCAEIITKLHLSIKAVNKDYTEILLSFIYGIDEADEDIKLWNTFKETSIKIIILNYLLKEHGVEWCHNNLDLTAAEKIQIMAETLGRRD